MTMNKIIGTGLCLLLAFFSVAQGSNESRYAQPELPGSIMIDIGMNSMNGAPDELDINAFNSRSVGIYYSHVFKISDRFTFLPAIGITAEKWRIDNSLNFQLDDQNAIVFDTLRNRGGLRTNKLAINYVDIPLELRFYPWKTVGGEGLFVGIGGIIGARIESHTKIKYDSDQIRRTEKVRDSFGLERFRFGVQGRIGLNGIHLFAKYYLTDIFESGAAPGGTATPSQLSFGINISGF